MTAKTQREPEGRRKRIRKSHKSDKSKTRWEVVRYERSLFGTTSKIETFKGNKQKEKEGFGVVRTIFAFEVVSFDSVKSAT